MIKSKRSNIPILEITETVKKKCGEKETGKIIQENIPEMNKESVYKISLSKYLHIDFSTCHIPAQNSLNGIFLPSNLISALSN